MGLGSDEWPFLEILWNNLALVPIFIDSLTEHTNNLSAGSQMNEKLV